MRKASKRQTDLASVTGDKTTTLTKAFPTDIKLDNRPFSCSLDARSLAILQARFSRSVSSLVQTYVTSSSCFKDHCDRFAPSQTRGFLKNRRGTSPGA